MATEIRVKHDEIRDNQTIRVVLENHFKARGLDLHINEVEEFEDDFKRGERVMKVKNTRYFPMGGK
jgi:hypothetical protein